MMANKLIICMDCGRRVCCLMISPRVPRFCCSCCLYDECPFEAVQPDQIGEIICNKCKGGEK